MTFYSNNLMAVWFGFSCGKILLDIREESIIYQLRFFAEILINIEENQTELTLSEVSKKVDVNFELVDF